MIQREREAEGDEFAEKEQFVTQAYKDQMAEVRRAELEEKQREGVFTNVLFKCCADFANLALEKTKKGSSTGMAHFYRQLLERSEEQHSATVAATKPSPTPIGPEGPNFTITKPPDFASRSDAELARLARAEGKEVELNDDNIIVDKRELLSAGLNLAAPNTRQLGSSRTLKYKVAAAGEEVQVHRATGAAASRREIQERRARELQRQILEEQERLDREKEREEREQEGRTVAKRNNEVEIEGARARYFERKRRRVEEASAVAVDHDVNQQILGT